MYNINWRSSNQNSLTTVTWDNINLWLFSLWFKHIIVACKISQSFLKDIQIAVCRLQSVISYCLCHSQQRKLSLHLNGLVPTPQQLSTSTTKPNSTPKNILAHKCTTSECAVSTKIASAPGSNNTCSCEGLVPQRQYYI